jgi:hypothetical protein
MPFRSRIARYSALVEFRVLAVDTRHHLGPAVRPQELRALLGQRHRIFSFGAACAAQHTITAIPIIARMIPPAAKML